MFFDHYLRHLRVLAISDEIERRRNKRLLRWPYFGFRLLFSSHDLQRKDRLVVVKALQQPLAIILLAPLIDSQGDDLADRLRLTSQRGSESLRRIPDGWRSEFGFDHDWSAVSLTDDDVRATSAADQRSVALGIRPPHVADLFQPIGDRDVRRMLVQLTDFVVAESHCQPRSVPVDGDGALEGWFGGVG